MCLARTAMDAKREFIQIRMFYSVCRSFGRGLDVKQWYRNTNNRLSTVNQQTIELITARLTSNRHNDKDRSCLRQLSSDMRVNARHIKSARGTSSKQSSWAVWKFRWPFWAPAVPNSLYGLCGRKATFEEDLQTLKTPITLCYYETLRFLVLYAINACKHFSSVFIPCSWRHT